MKVLAGRGTLLIAAILSVQQLSSGFPFALSAPNVFGDLVRRIEPIIEPISHPEPGPVVPVPAPRLGSDPETPAEPPTHLGSDDPAPADPAGPASPPAHLGSDPAPAPPSLATRGTEADLRAMGLMPNTPERAAFDTFGDWFENTIATNPQFTGKSWLFYTRLGDIDTTHFGELMIDKFKADFQTGSYRLDGDDGSNQVQSLSDVFSLKSMDNGLLGDPPASNERFWWDMVASYGSARMAAVEGGNVRILMPTGVPDLPPGKFWTDIEAYELTREGSNVKKIWRYDAANLDTLPEPIWQRGDPPLGNPAVFVTPRTTPELDEPEGSIAAGDVS